MRTLISAAMIAVTLAPLPALAETPRHAQREYRRDVREAKRDYRRDVRDARQDRNRAIRSNRSHYTHRTTYVRPAYRAPVRTVYRQPVRDWRAYNRYDYNRFEPGQRYYYADRYYRPGNYRTRVLTRNDRLYRGYNGQYYCRRSDGTTGLIIGGLAGGVLGNVLTNGNSNLLGTLIGAGAGAALGSSIDRGNVRCR